MNSVRAAAGKVKRITKKILTLVAGGNSNESYWTGRNVTHHQTFATPQESLDWFDWRNDQYIGYIELMPVAGQDDKVVLDYGCGPGNDLVGFGHFSRPRRLIGADISPSSLAEAQLRLAVHGIPANLIKIDENGNRLALEDGSVDYLHSSGVVHHARDPQAVLKEFRRVLKPTGRCRIMVYHYPSVWVHLYVAYLRQIVEARDEGTDIRAAFATSTDGEHCPIARVYKPTEFAALAASSGFHCRFLGAAISLHEMKVLEHRFSAIEHPRLAAEHRKFLLGLTFDARGLPWHDGHLAGVDGCYELTPLQ
jgi:SAM-dependent methyltransferase